METLGYVCASLAITAAIMAPAYLFYVHIFGGPNAHYTWKRSELPKHTGTNWEADQEFLKAKEISMSYSRDPALQKMLSRIELAEKQLEMLQASVDKQLKSAKIKKRKKK